MWTRPHCPLAGSSPCARLPAGPTPLTPCQPRCCLSAQPRWWNLEDFPKQYSIRILKSHLHTAHICGSHSSVLLFPKRAQETPHNHQSQGSAPGSISEMELGSISADPDLSGWSPLQKMFLVPLSPTCSPKDALESILGSPSRFSSLRDGTHNTLGTAWVSHPARILCLPFPWSWNSMDPRGWEHPSRIPSWMLSPVVSKRAGRNEKKWDEDKMEISSSATDWAEGV